MCSIKGHRSQMRSTNVLFLRSHISWADVNLLMRCCISEWCLCEAVSDACPWIHGSLMPLCLCLCVRGLLNTCVNGWPQMCGHVRDFRCTSSCVRLWVQGWAVTKPCLLADVTVPAPLRGGSAGGGGRSRHRNEPGTRQEHRRPRQCLTAEAARAGMEPGWGPGGPSLQGSAVEPSQPRLVPGGPSGRAKKRWRDKQDVTPRLQQGHGEQEAGATVLLSHLVSWLEWTLLNRQGGGRGRGNHWKAGKDGKIISPLFLKTCSCSCRTAVSNWRKRLKD